MKKEIVSYVSKFITWVFERNIECFYISVIISIIYYFYKKTSLIELFLMFFLFFCLSTLLTSLVERIKNIIDKKLEKKKEEKDAFNLYEERIKQIINILNNKESVEKFKELAFKKYLIIREEDKDIYYHFENIMYQQDICVKINHMAKGKEYIMEKDYANTVKRFFKVHKNNYMEYVYSDFLDKKNEDKIGKQNTEDNKNEPRKIKNRHLTNKQKRKILFNFWFRQKNLESNPDFPFYALQSVLGDIVVFIITVYILAFCVMNIWGCITMFLKFGICIKSIFVSIVTILVIISMYNIVCFLRYISKTLSDYIYDKNLSANLISIFVAVLALVVSFIAIVKG